MIDDDETYRKMNRDPTATYQTRNNNFAKRLADLKLIDRATELRLKTCINSAHKAHKEACR